jgi:hypothetical protein
MTPLNESAVSLAWLVSILAKADSAGALRSSPNAVPDFPAVEASFDRTRLLTEQGAVMDPHGKDSDHNLDPQSLTTGVSCRKE